MGSLALAYLAGLMTIFNPCVLPLAPILFASAAAQDRRGPLALAAGMALTFGLAGGFIASLGVELGDSLVLRVVSSGLMIIIGLAMAVPVLGHSGERALAPLAAWGQKLGDRLPAAGLWGQAGLGAVLALAWGPCVGPTLGAALVLATRSGTLALAMLTMGIFALGSATSLLAAGWGLGKLTPRNRGSVRQTAFFGRVVLGAVLVMLGVLSLTGLDHRLERLLVEAMPDWLVSFATRF